MRTTIFLIMFCCGILCFGVRAVAQQSGDTLTPALYKAWQKWKPYEKPAKKQEKKQVQKREKSDTVVAKKEGEKRARFTSIDPLWETYRSWSPYHYSRNNPLVLRDPSGLADYIDPDGTKLGNDGEKNSDIYYTTGDIYKKYTTVQGTDWASVRTAEGTELRPPQEAVQGVYDNVYLKATSPNKKDNMQEHGGAIGEDGKFYTGEKTEETDIRSGKVEFDSNPAILRMANTLGVYPVRTVHSHLQSTAGFTASGQPSDADYTVQTSWKQQLPNLQNAILVNPNNGGWVTFYNERNVTISIRASVFFQGVSK